MSEQSRGRGRPRTRPVGAKLRSLYLTDEEYARVERAANAAGVCPSQFLRDLALKSTGKRISKNIPECP